MAACNAIDGDEASSLVAYAQAAFDKLMSLTATGNLSEYKALLQQHCLSITEACQLFNAACSSRRSSTAITSSFNDAVRFSHDEGGRLIDMNDYDLRQVLPVLQGIETASKEAGMLAEYEEDLKIALSQTNDDGSTVLKRLLKSFWLWPCLELLEYVLTCESPPLLDELSITYFMQ